MQASIIEIKWMRHFLSSIPELKSILKICTRESHESLPMCWCGAAFHFQNWIRMNFFFASTLDITRPNRSNRHTLIRIKNIDFIGTNTLLFKYFMQINPNGDQNHRKKNPQNNAKKENWTEKIYDESNKIHIVNVTGKRSFTCKPKSTTFIWICCVLLVQAKTTYNTRFCM